jgi:hypothetical protein
MTQVRPETVIIASRCKQAGWSFFAERQQILKRVDEKPGAQLRLEPGALWRHDLIRIGDRH